MIEVLERPARQIEGRTSRWVAASNPIIYRFQRRDQEITSVSNNAGQIRITVNGVDLTNEISVGDVLYLNSGGVYDQNVTVTGITFSTNTIIDCNGDSFISATSGGFINLFSREFYFLEIEVVDEATDRNLFATAFSFIPDPKGVIVADFSIYIRERLGNLNNFNYAAPNAIAPGFSKGFYLKYTEQWQGSSETQVDDAANPIWAVNAVRQVGQELGQNLGEYVPFDMNKPGKFLCVFDIPRISRGYPFSLSFIYSDIISGVGGGMRKIETSLGLNDVVISTGSEDLNTSSPFQKSINRVRVNNPVDDEVKAVVVGIVIDISTLLSIGFYQLNDVFFQENLETVGLSCGANGTILKSENSGVDWSQIVSGTTNDLNAVMGFNAFAFAVGNNGTVLRSTNLGDTWSSLPAYTGTANVKGLVTKDELTTGIYVCDQAGAIYRGTNVGQAWAEIATGIMTPLNGIDASRSGVIDWIISVGNNGEIVRVENGVTVTNPASGTNENLLAVVTISPDTAFAVGDNGTILKSIDQGQTWEDISIPSATFSIRDIKFIDSLNGYFITDEARNVWLTTDGGQSWQQTTIELVSFFGLGIGPGGSVFACGFTEIVAELQTFPIIEGQRLEVQAPCVNPVYLAWNNSLGGDSYYMFDFNQVKETIFEDSEKFEQWTLYAEQLTENEFLTLDELNTEATESREFFDELATADRTLNKRGIQVYEVQQDGTRVGVIVRSRSQQRETRFPTSDIVIRIKRPQQFKALV